MSKIYLGLDLSSTGLKCIAITPTLKAVHEESIVFDKDLPSYGTTGGVHKNAESNEVYAPVAMWIEALGILFLRMKENGFVFGDVVGVTGAGQQHGSVYWSSRAEEVLGNMNEREGLVELICDGGAFTHPWSPNWQDHSTQVECEEFENAVGGPEALASITGSRAHHRFTGPQISRFRKRFPEVYKNTRRISLVSSFLCTLFLGRIAPLDCSDVCGMNLWDIRKNSWDAMLLATAAGGAEYVDELARKLGGVEQTPGKKLGNINTWFVERFGFNKECAVFPFTGDNPSTILALPLRPLDAIVSLGTSTTLLMVTPTYHPSTEYHLFKHPTTAGLYMFMLCYCNGSLARESVRDTLNSALSPPAPPNPWSLFNTTALTAPIAGSPAKIGLYFPLPENIPSVPAGTWRFNYDAGTKSIVSTTDGWRIPHDDARAILESQALSMRLRASPLLAPSTDSGNTKSQPRRLYIVGGASNNRTIAQITGDVLGASDGVYKLDISGGNACALGAAYYSAWAAEKNTTDTLSFEDFVAQRWDEGQRVVRVGEGYREGVWERYGELLDGLLSAEKEIIKA